MLAEAQPPPVETERRSSAERRFRGFVVLPHSTLECARVNDRKRRGKDIPPAVFSEDPDSELEEKLREHPDDANAKVDVGSDESMDASDPPAAVQPAGGEPVPSSGYPEGEEGERKGS
jgi:hypothetical protein